MPRASVWIRRRSNVDVSSERSPTTGVTCRPASTVHTMRAPGMTWHRMPLFVWGIYATSIIQVIATPVVGVNFLLLALVLFLMIKVINTLKRTMPEEEPVEVEAEVPVVELYLKEIRDLMVDQNKKAE